MPLFLWTQKQDIGPTGRAGHAAAYDASRGRTVLFGGIAGGAAVGDTWEWNGDLWTQVQDTGPSAREGSALGYDAGRQQAILFGGEAGGVAFGDTWRWDGGDWTQVADTGPAARAGHAVAYDLGRERIVLFGGATSAGPMGDTWEWDGELWTQVEDIGPSSRANHCLAFDPTSSRALLFGGVGAGAAGLDDTWAWDGSGWTQVADTGPTPRAGAAMAATTATVILFGGIDSMDPSPGAAHSALADTWNWDGTKWTQVQDIGPGARWRHAMTFESAEGRLVLFGGLSAFALPGDPSMPASLLGDTWVHETEAGAPAEPGEPVVVSGVTVGTGSLDSAGASVDVSFTLSGPAPPGGVNVLTVAAYLATDHYEIVPPDVLSLPGSVSVGPGNTGGGFTVVRGTGAAEPTEYIVSAAVEGTTFEQIATLPVA